MFSPLCWRALHKHQVTYLPSAQLFLSLLCTACHLRDTESTTSSLSPPSYPATIPTMTLQGSLTSSEQTRPVPAPRTSSRLSCPPPRRNLPCKNVARTSNVPYGDHCRGGADGGGKVVQFFQNVNRAWNNLVSRPLAASAAQQHATTRSQHSVRTQGSSKGQDTWHLWKVDTDAGNLSPTCSNPWYCAAKCRSCSFRTTDGFTRGLLNTVLMNAKVEAG